MESVGPYKILEHLGAGALGELFRARDTRLGRGVALRQVDAKLAADPATREAIVAAARRLCAFTHPNVASLFDVVEDGERLFLVHELAAGQSLASLTSGGGPLPERRAISVAAQVADALAAAADAGLVHGALGLTNILLTAGDQVKVLDLGLSSWTAAGRSRREAARALDDESAGADAAADDAAYVSPEQVLGAPGDVRSDVFALGVVLHTLLTGRPPFAGDTAGATLLKVVQATPLPPSQGNPAVPPQADAIVQRALAKSLDARSTAAAMAEDLRTLRSALPDTKTRPEAPANRGGSRPPPPRRVGRAVWLGATVALLVAAAGAAAWFGRNALGLPWQDVERSSQRPTVLVLSFAVGGDSPPAYFGPGFAEDLASRLSEIPGSAVVGRASIRSAEHESDWQARARRLHATVVVRGTVTPGPYALHADVEMLDVETGASRWAQHFAREPRQVSGLEVEIAGQIAQRLRLVTPTSNRWARASMRQIEPAAYDLYLQGRDAADHRDRAKAIALYDEALQRDQRLVEARASLAQALYLEEFYAGSVREPSSSGRALREAEAALAVDAELPAAHVAVALAAPTITMAASSLARALAYDPSNGEAWHHAGDLVSELDPPRSIGFYRASLTYEPTIDANWRDLAAAYAAAGNQAEAGKAVAAGEAARPDRPWWKQMRARLDVGQARYDEAVSELGNDPSVETTPIVWLMGRVVPMALAGRLVDARREALRLNERHPAFCEGRAVLAALEIDAGAADAGKAMASAILADAARVDAEPALKVCAALAAAGTGDPAEAASWLSRVAGDERALRLWTRQAIFGVGLSFRERWYPWTKVVGSQPMQVAGSQLDQSLARLRDEVERRLPAPPGSAEPVR
jgi:eukaryotic-like serine/threonine-protein kinase